MARWSIRSGCRSAIGKPRTPTTSSTRKSAKKRRPVIRYEQAEPFKFTRIDTPNRKRAKGSHPKSKLKSEPDKGLIVVDEDTQLTGVPREAWDYRLGNRSAIDWVLDQHKEKTPRDPTVREKFNTYRFADYKESMIDLLARVITVSLETVKITQAMARLERGE
jgi:predicted helicase